MATHTLFSAAKGWEGKLKGAKGEKESGRKGCCGTEAC